MKMQEKRRPEQALQINILDFGAVSGGVVDCTKAIAAAILEAGKSGGEVYVPSGTYLTGALFLRSHVGLYLEKGAVLLGIPEDRAYPLLLSRVAGIEMRWPAGLVNVRGAEDVTIRGEGTIDGQGAYWWEKYWGKDRRGGMRARYDAQGLRWAVDYDCRRVRNILVYNSKKVRIEGICSKRSGFWNLHICYCNEVLVRGVTICENDGPSTDGIDIDSSRGVAVQNCTISCNDDNICVKAGRDADGLRVNRPCEDVQIENCTVLAGEGITLGSETSGGMRNILIRNNVFRGTKNGLRMKSCRTRGGLIEAVTAEGLKMENVGSPFNFQLDWYPAYNQCEIPPGYTGRVPAHWHTLLQPVAAAQGLPRARDIQVRRVEVSTRGTALFDIYGLPELPIEDLRFEDVKARAAETGRIANVRGLRLDGLQIDLC